MYDRGNGYPRVRDILRTPGVQLKQSGVPDQVKTPPGLVKKLEPDEIAAVKLSGQFAVAIDVPDDLQLDVSEAFTVKERSPKEETDCEPPDGSGESSQKRQDGKQEEVNKVAVCTLLENLGSDSHYVLSDMKVKMRHGNPRVYLTFSRSKPEESVTEKQAKVISKLFCGGIYKTAKLSVFYEEGRFDFAVINLYGFELNKSNSKYYLGLSHDRLSLQEA